MAVIKKFEPRTADVKQLEWILNQLTPEQDKLKRLVLGDLKRIRHGDKAERNSSYLLDQLYADRSDAILLHGLRLELDDQVAQIDHLAINRFGIVTLFETKSFSTGIKVDAKGVFWRWNRFKKRYIEMASPIKQSERHIRVLTKQLAEMGFSPAGFRHFVLVDYQAKLIKPEKGFEQVCRPDRIKDAMMQSSTSHGLGGWLKSLTRIFAKSYSEAELQQVGQHLLSQHQSIKMDYLTKYGLDWTYEPEDEPEQNDSRQDDDAMDSKPRLERLTMAKLARVMGINASELQARLFEHDYLEPRGFKTFVTEKGKAEGIQFRKGRRGFFFLLPARLADEAVLQVPAKPVEPNEAKE